ncbi:TlpA disulfide reductase family protein [Pedobacter sp. Du54]|uniref:TlpA family protein disulfide reductase n=1 Tax=Pedobacter anseongensis TaxID=3133439 RepID=UPI0030ADA407
MRKQIFITTLFLFFSCALQAQQPAGTGNIMEGNKAPALVLDIYKNGVANPKRTSLEAYIGKWLVIEFWGKYCVSCIEGFPHLEALRKHFGTQANFLLIGGNHPRYDQGIKEFYARFRNEYGLGFDTAFDTLAFKRFKISSTPTAVVISPIGGVALITSGAKLDEKILNRLFSGIPTDYGTERNNLPLNTFTDTADNMDHYSTIGGSINGDRPMLQLDLSRGVKDGKFDTWPISLARLYMLASFGKAVFLPSDTLAATVWPAPVLEVTDSSYFSIDKGRKSPYQYHLQLKSQGADLNAVQAAIAADLREWFGYRTEISLRKMPVLKLVIIDEEKFGLLKSVSSATSRTGDATGYRFRNLTSASFARLLRKYLPSHVIIDCTQADYGIDLDFSANMTNVSSISKALRPFGLDLIKTTETLKVLVLTDPVISKQKREQ